MLAMTKRLEYGIIAMTYLSGLDQDRRASVGQIAGASAVPRELLAKILSVLVKAGLVESYSGPAGGFRLAKAASETSLLEILRALERRPGLIPCTDGREGCSLSRSCRIRTPMMNVHFKLRRVLEETTLADLAPSATKERPGLKHASLMNSAPAKE
jgi:Rrf2 family protein